MVLWALAIVGRNLIDNNTRLQLCLPQKVPTCSRVFVRKQNKVKCCTIYRKVQGMSALLVPRVHQSGTCLPVQKNSIQQLL